MSEVEPSPVFMRATEAPLPFRSSITGSTDPCFAATETSTSETPLHRDTNGVVGGGSELSLAVSSVTGGSGGGGVDGTGTASAVGGLAGTSTNRGTGATGSLAASRGLEHASRDTTGVRKRHFVRLAMVEG